VLISHVRFERKGSSPQENREIPIRKNRNQLAAAAFDRTQFDEMVKAHAKDAGAFRGSSKNKGAR
jgi:hypothetical protein